MAVPASDPFLFLQQVTADVDASQSAAGEDQATAPPTGGVHLDQSSVLGSAGSSPVSSPAVSPVQTTGLGPCGGDLPPCSVVLHESATAGLYAAYNPGGCDGHGCYGKWQFSGAWAGKLGLGPDPVAWTPEEQDNAARILWAGGAGCSNWSAC